MFQLRTEYVQKASRYLLAFSVSLQLLALATPGVKKKQKLLPQAKALHNDTITLWVRSPQVHQLPAPLSH